MAQYGSLGGEDKFERLKQARTAAGAAQLDAAMRAEALMRQQQTDVVAKSDKVILQYTNISGDKKSYHIRIHQSGKVVRIELDENGSEAKKKEKHIPDYQLRSLIERITGHKFERVKGGDKPVYELRVPKPAEHVTLEVNYGDAKVRYETQNASHGSPHVGLRELESLFFEK